MMNKIIIQFLLLISFCYANAQSPVLQWQKSFGGTNQDTATTILQTPDGGYIVAGESFSTDEDVTGNYGSSDYWIVKLNSMSVIQWQKNLGGSNIDWANSIQQTNDGGYIIAGYTTSTDGDVTGNHGVYDYWIVKLSASGNIQWEKSFGGTNTDMAYSIQHISDGGYIVAGCTRSINGDVTGNHGVYDYWVIKLDIAGDIQWQKTYGGTGDDRAFSIKQTSDGGYIVAGYSTSIDGDVTGNHGSNDYWVVKLDITGNIQWQKAIGGIGNDWAHSVQQTNDGGYIVAGYSNSIDGDVTGNHGSYDYWIVKLDVIGNLQWQKSFGGSDIDRATSMQQTTDGGYVVAGYAVSNDGDVTANHGGADSWVIKIDGVGNIQWQKTLGGSSYDDILGIQQTADGGYVVAGSTFSTDGDVTGNHGTVDFWVVKLDQDELALSNFTQNILNIYPNPACTFLYLKTSDDKKIDKIIITDLMGRIIKQFTTNNQVLNIEFLVQGTYIIEAYSGNEKYNNKFIKE